MTETECWDDAPVQGPQLPPEEQVKRLDDAAVDARYFEWKRWAFPKQLPPEGDWTTWLLMGGRGSGKTRAGAEWVRMLARDRVSPIALVGETMTEALSIMVRGESGILGVHPDEDRPILRGGNRLVWPNGVEASIMTASDPERFRGPQFAAAWCDELGCGAVDKGANQPNIFGDGKSAEGGRPYFSNGAPDALMQRQYLRAHQKHWSDPKKNPAGMVDAERIYCWSWDARPYPAFPALSDVWADGANHLTGHWLTGRLGGMANDELAVAIARDHGVTLLAAASQPMVAGVVLTAPGTARDALEPLLEITGQRLLARAGVLTTVAARGAVKATLTREILAQGESAVIARRRSAAEERPARLALSHVDRDRDYLVATAMAIRPGTGPAVAESVSMVLDGTAARLAAERLLDDRAASLDTVELALSPSQIALEPGDRISVAELAEGPFEITEIRDGLMRLVTARAVTAGTSVAAGVTRAPVTAPVAGMAAVPLIAMAHLPPDPADPQRSRLAIAGFAKPWPGTVRMVDGATGATLTQLDRPAALGEVVGGLGIGPRTLWDRANPLTVRLYGGHLADAAEEAVLAGSNRLAVETDAGLWEVIGFGSAELVEPSLYRLSQLLRGVSGTDAAMSAISAGRRVMVLDGRVAVLPVDAGWIGETRHIRAYAGANDLAGQALTAHLPLAGALPLAPVHLRAARQGDGSIRFDWIRRSRADDGAWGVGEPALDVAPELYRLSILVGTTVKRVVEASSCSAIYGLADQVSDFGGPATGFSFTVSQVSPVFGPGHKGEKTYG